MIKDKLAARPFLHVSLPQDMSISDRMSQFHGFISCSQLLRHPLRIERACAKSRYVMINEANMLSSSYMRLLFSSETALDTVNTPDATTKIKHDKVILQVQNHETLKLVFTWGGGVDKALNLTYTSLKYQVFVMLDTLLLESVTSIWCFTQAVKFSVRSTLYLMLQPPRHPHSQSFSINVMIYPKYQPNPTPTQTKMWRSKTFSGPQILIQSKKTCCS